MSGADRPPERFPTSLTERVCMSRCTSCKGRKWHVDQITRKKIDCPVCEGTGLRNAEGSTAPNQKENRYPAKQDKKMLVYKVLRDMSEKFHPKSYMEIGVREGLSLSVVLNSCSFLEKLLLCDTWGSEAGGTGRGNHDHIDTILKAYPKVKTKYLDGLSQSTVPKYHKENPIDLYEMILVDGDHAEKQADKDIRNAWEMLSDGGIMIVDDIGHPAHGYLKDMAVTFAEGKNAEVIFINSEMPTGVIVISKKGSKDK